nr:unnamed protein product [Digitaria exilis]
MRLVPSPSARPESAPQKSPAVEEIRINPKPARRSSRTSARYRLEELPSSHSGGGPSPANRVGSLATTSTMHRLPAVAATAASEGAPTATGGREQHSDERLAADRAERRWLCQRRPMRTIAVAQVVAVTVACRRMQWPAEC